MARIAWSGTPSAASWWLPAALRPVTRTVINLVCAAGERRLRHDPRTIGQWAVWPKLVTFDNAIGRVMRPPKGTATAPVELVDCRAEWVRAAGVRPGGRVVLYFHGGAFIAGGLGSHRQMTARISAEADASVLNVAYRMLPQWTIEDAIDDGVAAYRKLLADGIEPARIVIGGDSAGGGLAFLVACALREQGLARPAAIVALSPWAYLDLSDMHAHPTASRDLLALPRLAQLVTALLNRSRPLDQVPSPANCDLRGLPPVLIHAGTKETLEPDAVKLTERLAASGVPVEFKRWRGQVHVFQFTAGVVAEGRQALREIGDFIKQFTADGAAVDIPGTAAMTGH
ncbi:hypothetical protein A7G45_23575 [Mycolicibacterium llatzerense]|nr:hypothetical protein [Mycolicibacterium llatzerense]